ncbi:LysR family transcriptional regulator [Virgibacillus sp. JSM 102003]|uniref:LysR family transcriptional regulator n=1 Tax=Virgibacillus sp. JSM 102003 TaxID=1562108 RepID=UPI0035BFFCEB
MLVIDTRTLKTFILAAEQENFRIVSEKLFITQPAVSSQIRQLEKEIGGKLFNKCGRHIKLTELGRLFHTEAKEIVAQSERSLSQISKFQQGFNKTLRIAISPLLADTILPSILREYTKEFPHVELSIKVLESMEIASVVEEGIVDVGLSCLPGESNVSWIKLHEESVGLVCNHDGYDEESGPIVDAKEVLESNIVLTDNHPSYWNNLKEQLKYTLSSYQFMSVTQSHIAKRFVLEGIGVSFLPKSIVNREIIEGRLMEIPVFFMELPTASMYIIYKYEHEIESEFVKFISDFHFS